MSFGLFKNCYLQTICLQIIFDLSKQNLALNNLQVLICNKNQPTNHKCQNHIYSKTVVILFNQ